MKNIEQLMKALANRRRIEIVRYIYKNKKITVGEIAQHIKLSFKSTSRHLTILKSAEIIEGEQISLSVFYSLREPVHPIVKILIVD